VTVVVDRGALGGGIDEVCNASGGGKTATTLFTGSGFSLTYVQQTPGFVCRINGQPASDPCVQTPPSDAYWGLWWSDGTSGSWSYASVAAGSLSVPDGGYVAFAWQSGSKSPPGVPATAHASSSSPSPTATPSSSPSTGGSGGGSGGGGNGGGHNGGGNGSGGGNGGGGGHASASPTPSAGPTSSAAVASATPSATPSTSVSASPTGKGGNGGTGGPGATPTTSSSALPTPGTDSVSPAASADGSAEVQTTGGGSALPVWVVPVVILALAAGAGVAFVVRRRGRPVP
jgi:hypothetical protein